MVGCYASYTTLTSTDPIDKWLNTANRAYTMQVCHQPGLPPFNPSEPPARNLSLDGNLAACVAFNSCNWGEPGLTQEECEQSFRGQFMCADCTDGYCTDVRSPMSVTNAWHLTLVCSNP